MINNYELLILNYIFNALHDFNSHHSINIGTLGLINLKRNRKVLIPGAAGDLAGLCGEGVCPGMGAGTAAPAPQCGGQGAISRVGNSGDASEPTATLFWGWGGGELCGAGETIADGFGEPGAPFLHPPSIPPMAPRQGG